MIEGFTLALALASFGTAAGEPRFAEDFPQGVGYVAILEIIPYENGIAKMCTLSGVKGPAGAEPPPNVFPSQAYVMDACRKLRTAKWEVTRDEAGNIEAQFYFCRYVQSFPDRAFCDRQLGE